MSIFLKNHKHKKLIKQMKKIIAILSLAVGVYSSSQAQGLVSVYNIGGVYANHTNSALSVYDGGTGNGGVSGLASTAANGFYYALLIATNAFSVAPSPSLNPTSTEWSAAMMATNYLVGGGIRGSGGSGGVAISGWAGGQTNYIELVGWSSSLGTTWSQVASQVASGSFTASGFFGVSSLAYVTAATSPSPATSIFGGTGLASGVTMYAVTTSVPEPSTMALAGLGGAALLLFRRRK